MKISNKYLTSKEKSILSVQPELASAIGLNESIFLRQLSFWIENDYGIKRAGRRWVWNSYVDWAKQFPFYSLRTIQRIIKSAKELGVLLVERFERHKNDQTNYYAIDFDRLDEIMGQYEADHPPKSTDNPSDNMAGEGVTSCHTPSDNVAKCIKEQRKPTKKTTPTTIGENRKSKESDQASSSFVFPENLDEKVCKEARSILKNLSSEEGQDCLNVLSSTIKKSGKMIKNQAAYLQKLAHSAASGELGKSSLIANHTPPIADSFTPVRGQVSEGATRRDELYSQLCFYVEEAKRQGVKFASKSQMITAWANQFNHPYALKALKEYQQLQG